MLSNQVLALLAVFFGLNNAAPATKAFDCNTCKADVDALTESEFYFCLSKWANKECPRPVRGLMARSQPLEYGPPITSSPMAPVYSALTATAASPESYGPPSYPTCVPATVTVIATPAYCKPITVATPPGWPHTTWPTSKTSCTSTKTQTRTISSTTTQTLTKPTPMTSSTSTSCTKSKTKSTSCTSSSSSPTSPIPMASTTHSMPPKASTSCTSSKTMSTTSTKPMMPMTYTMPTPPASSYSTQSTTESRPNSSMTYPPVAPSSTLKTMTTSLPITPYSASTSATTASTSIKTSTVASPHPYRPTDVLPPSSAAIGNKVGAITSIAVGLSAFVLFL